ncbi:hypothetical protein Tco_0728577 [Tanacetum coccineum]|uniref:Uncharacterized protein n=1 Tax=Tanacetum coccineum TaxID=301880 RepID=A0ABQ4YMK5_9ASTR
MQHTIENSKASGSKAEDVKKYQVNPKVSHLHAVKRIFRYLKGQPKLGLWYLKDSPFDLVAYTDSDYAGASLDRKSTTGGCQFLGCRLISWQCKKQTVVVNSIREAEYVGASSCLLLVILNIAEFLLLVILNTVSLSGKNYQWGIDEELAFKLEAKEEEEERLAREKAQQIEEANITWDDIQAKIEADYQLAQRLLAQEQDEFTDEEKERLFVQFLEQRRKHFVAKRAEEKRNGLPTRAQQRSIMCTYLKNMEGWKPKSLKNKFFTNIQELFDKAMKRVNTFVDYRTELVEESSKKAEAEIAHESSLKRAGELEQESSRKQKLEEDKESEELKKCLEIIPDDGDDVTIHATHLSTKSPTIMPKNFNKEDLEVLWSIVKARFKKTEPVNYMDNFLLLNLKTMFEHHVKDNNMQFYLLVEKIYPLTNHTLHQMFNDVKLQVYYECEMAFELLRLVKKHLKEGYGMIVGIKSLLEVTAAKSDQVEEGPNYALMTYSSLSSDSEIVDNCKKGLGYEKYNAVPPPYTGNFMPPTPDLSFTGLDEFVNKPVVENRKSDEEVSEIVRKNDDAPIIEEWVSDSEEENVSQTKTKKKTVKAASMLD